MFKVLPLANPLSAFGHSAEALSLLPAVLYRTVGIFHPCPRSCYIQNLVGLRPQRRSAVTSPRCTVQDCGDFSSMSKVLPLANPLSAFRPGRGWSCIPGQRLRRGRRLSRRQIGGAEVALGAMPAHGGKEQLCDCVKPADVDVLMG